MYTLRVLTIVSYLARTKYEFLPDVANKTVTCYTFSVRPTILESENLEITKKKFDEEQNEDFCEDEYFNFEGLIFGEEKHFEQFFAVDGVSFTELTIDFRKFL